MSSVKLYVAKEGYGFQQETNLSNLSKDLTLEVRKSLNKAFAKPRREEMVPVTCGIIFDDASISFPDLFMKYPTVKLAELETFMIVRSTKHAAFPKCGANYNKNTTRAWRNLTVNWDDLVLVTVELNERGPQGKFGSFSQTFLTNFAENVVATGQFLNQQERQELLCKKSLLASVMNHYNSLLGFLRENRTLKEVDTDIRTQITQMGGELKSSARGLDRTMSPHDQLTVCKAPCACVLKARSLLTIKLVILWEKVEAVYGDLVVVGIQGAKSLLGSETSGSSLCLQPSSFGSQVGARQSLSSRIPMARAPGTPIQQALPSTSGAGAASAHINATGNSQPFKTAFGQPASVNTANVRHPTTAPASASSLVFGQSAQACLQKVQMGGINSFGQLRPTTAPQCPPAALGFAPVLNVPTPLNPSNSNTLRNGSVELKASRSSEQPPVQIKTVSMQPVTETRQQAVVQNLQVYEERCQNISGHLRRLSQSSGSRRDAEQVQAINGELDQFKREMQHIEKTQGTDIGVFQFLTKASEWYSWASQMAQNLKSKFG